MVSDGIFDPLHKFGSAAWIKDPGIIGPKLWARHYIPGEANDQDPYRSEISGLLGAIYKIHKICKIHNIAIGSITIACNGLSAVDKPKDFSYPVIYQLKNYDLLYSFEQQVKESILIWRFKHV